MLVGGKLADRSWAQAIHLATKEATDYSDVAGCETAKALDGKPSGDFLQWAYKTDSKEAAQGEFQKDNQTNEIVPHVAQTQDMGWVSTSQEKERQRHASVVQNLSSKVPNATFSRAESAKFKVEGQPELVDINLEVLRQAVVAQPQQKMFIPVQVYDSDLADKFPSSLTALTIEDLATYYMADMHFDSQYTEALKTKKIFQPVAAYRIELPANWQQQQQHQQQQHQQQQHPNVPQQHPNVPQQPGGADKDRCILDALATLTECAKDNELLHGLIAEFRSKLASQVHVVAPASAQTAAVVRRRITPELMKGGAQDIFPF